MGWQVGGGGTGDKRPRKKLRQGPRVERRYLASDRAVGRDSVIHGQW